MSRTAYIVIQAKIDDGTECGYHIDSVWYTKRKADRKCNRLNKELQENPIWGEGLYMVEQIPISTKWEGKKNE